MLLWNGTSATLARSKTGLLPHTARKDLSPSSIQPGKPQIRSPSYHAKLLLRLLLRLRLLLLLLLNLSLLPNISLLLLLRPLPRLLLSLLPHVSLRLECSNDCMKLAAESLANLESAADSSANLECLLSRSERFPLLLLPHLELLQRRLGK